MSTQERTTKSPSPYTCPECQGTLFETRNGKLVWFQCRVGHSYSVESLLDGQDDTVERLIWGAIKGLEEQAEYTSRMAQWSNDGSAAKRYKQRSAKLKRNADAIRKIVTDGSEQNR